MHTFWNSEELLEKEHENPTGKLLRLGMVKEYCRRNMKYYWEIAETW